MTPAQMKEKAKQANMFAGVWHNQHNSEIELNIDDQGKVSGTFRKGKCKDEKENNGVEEFPLTGFVSNDVITFCVRFETHSCVTAWVGQLAPSLEYSDNNVLVTLWHMSVDVGNSAKDLLWKSIITGADNFVRGPRQSKTNTLKSSASYPFWTESLASAY